MPDLDPFTQTFTALWEMLSTRADFATLCKVGNQIRFDEDNNRDPIKQSVMTADLPEVILAPTGGVVKMHNSSSGSMCIRRFTWLLSTGDLRVSHLLYPVQFAIFRGMCGWKEKIGALTWNGKHFAKRCDVVSLSEGDSDPKRNRMIRGWSSAWTCEVEMHFTTADLISA